MECKWLNAFMALKPNAGQVFMPGDFFLLVFDDNGG